MASTPASSTARGSGSPEAAADSALSATSCQEVSPSRRAVRAGRARNAPAPGRVTTRPSAASTATARETVTGLTPYRSTSFRLGGSFSPGE